MTTSITGSPFAPAEEAPGEASRRSTEHRAGLRALGMSLAIVACLAFGFIATISVLGSLRESRDQVTAFDDYRYDLANGTAPVSQVDSNGAILPLGTAVAVIKIPALGLQQVVLNGTTSAVMMSGPGHRRDTVLPGQAGVSVIYGRRAAFGGPFAGLASLEPGASITTVTGQAESTYTVVAVRRAGDPIPAPAQTGRLTLITAAGDPYQPDGLLIVDADLTTDAQPADPLFLTRSSLDPAELALQGESSAWVGILLWSQLLLVVALLMTFAWARWSRWEAWLIGVPVLVAVGIGTSGQIAQLLPNLT